MFLVCINKVLFFWYFVFYSFRIEMVGLLRMKFFIRMIVLVGLDIFLSIFFKLLEINKIVGVIIIFYR